MTLVTFVIAWTLLAIPVALAVGTRLRRNRIANDAYDVHRWLTFIGRPQTAHDAACELGMTTSDVDDAFVWLWKHRLVDVHADRRRGGGDIVYTTRAHQPAETRT